MRKRMTYIASVLICFTLLLLTAAPGGALGQQTERVIRVGWYESGNDARPEEATGAHGYDYEYLQALSQYTGWTYEYVDGTWNDCLTWLQTGEVDLVGFVTKTDEREKIFGFPSLPMAVTNAWLITSVNSKLTSADKDALDGASIGIVKGVSFNAMFEEYRQSIGCTVRYVEFDTISDISPALENGQIDAAVLSDEDMTASELGLLRLDTASRYYAASVNNQALLKELDYALMQVNTYFPSLNSDLYKKYFNMNTYQRSVFTAAERDFIAKHPNILVKYDAGWPPIEYWDNEAGVYAGISPDVFALLSEKTGLHFVYEGSDSSQVLAELKSEGESNVLTTISFNYAWADQHNTHITKPFITSAIVRLGKNLDADHPTVAINQNAYFAYLLADKLADVNTLHFSKQSERLEAVRTGQADYTYVTEDQANYYCSIPKYADLRIEREAGYEQSVCISVARNSAPELLTILSKALANITHDEMTAIIMKNTVHSYTMTLGDMLYKYRLPAAVIAVLLIAIIIVLILMNSFKHKSEKKLEAAYEKERDAHARMREALDAAEKASAAKGSFMSRMSHEIRTPLNAIIGYNSLARDDLTSSKNDEDRKQADMRVMDCLTKSELASKHLLTIINDVLDMSAIESGKIKVASDRFDFKNLITSLTAIFYSQAKGKGVEFEVIFDTLTEEWFVGDQMRVNQILTNLLSNAIKFTSEGGSVKLKIQQPEAETNAAHIHFEVTDTGIGMTQEYLQHIWTPFEQADSSISRRYGGSGLGLSITKSLVDLMNGTITVQSTLGKGTVFGVDLTFQRTEQPKRTKTYDFSGINALVVDDDASTCDYVRLLFSRCGARCQTVNSGSEAVKAFTKAMTDGHRFTVCMVDWRMPQMDGIETVRRIREIAGSDIPIIIITAYDFSEIEETSKNAGVNLFISKPLFQSSLFDLLANICGRQALVSVSKSIEYNFGGARVLLAEDNAMNREVAKRVLQSVNLTVDCALNGLEAVNMFESVPAGTYKVILMDVQMPEMDGHEATRAIRASTHPGGKSIPIIAMTADAFAENVAEALASGMNDHVSKPIDMPKLFDILSKYITNVG